jgi:hypothetical protein
MDGLSFDWDFENASLGGVRRLGENWYHLESRPDTWFWFHFRLQGCAGRTVIFETDCYTPPRAFNDHWHGEGVVHRPWLSEDGGQSWQQVEHAEDEHHMAKVRFWHHFTADAAELCFTIPYTLTDLDSFLADCQHPDCVASVIGASRMGRPIHHLSIAPPPVRNQTGREGIWLLYREDACEVVTSFAAEGAIRFLLSDDPLAVAMRRRWEFHILPMVAVDGVVSGGTFSGGYGYMTNRWNDEPAPACLGCIRTAMTDWVEQGNRIIAAGKHHGEVQFTGLYNRTPTYFICNDASLGQSLANHTQQSGSFFRLTIRPPGRFERWVSDRFGFMPIYAAEIFAADRQPDFVRREGEGLIRGLGQFLDGQTDWSDPHWRAAAGDY